MSTEIKPDPAAVFAIALSLYRTLQDRGENNLSEVYGRGDEFMRQCMRVGEAFETYACAHVDFNNWPGGVWPYDLESYFGDAFMAHLGDSELRSAESAFPQILEFFRILSSTNRIPPRIKKI